MKKNFKRVWMAIFCLVAVLPCLEAGSYTQCAKNKTSIKMEDVTECKKTSVNASGFDISPLETFLLTI